MAATRALRTAVIAHLESAVPQVEGRVKTEKLAATPVPYLIVGGNSEQPGQHYGGPGAYEEGLDIRGVVRLARGDRPLWDLYEAVEAALQDVPITVDGCQDVIGRLRLMGPYQESLDSSLWTWAARYEALAIVT